MIGANISHYKILKKLGAGGRGEVYLAEHTRLNGEVVLTHPLPRYVSDRELGTRSKLRFQTAAALNHPISAAVCETDRSEGECSAYTEQVEGKPMEQLLLVTDIQQTDTRSP